jgi:hypothetical protein
MNLLGRLFGRKSQAIDDPVFGRMEYAQGLWTHIPTGKKAFMVIVVASESGPTDAQRAFFKKLCTSLGDTVMSAKGFVRASDSDADIVPLVLYSVEIGPEEEIARSAFTIELTDAEQSPIHRVEFTDGKPSAYGCDD